MPSAFQRVRSACLPGSMLPSCSPSPMAQTMAATVIQNSLNDQVLRTQTIVNGSVNSLQLLKLANFQDTLQNALGTVAGPK